MEADEKYMWLALDLAVQGLGRTSPNPMVGAVVVKDGEVIGSGYHHEAGAPHAEINALESAGERSKGAVLYVTLEPCSHFGRTPPCTEKIIASGIKKVVVSVLDPNPLMNGGGVKILEEAGIKVKVGVLEEKARKINEVFFKFITTGLPFVTLKTAMSLDGKIATHKGHSRWISSEKSRQFVHRLRNQVDAVMVGIGTVLTDNPRLNTRLEGDEDVRNPLRIIVDSRGRLPLEARLIKYIADSPVMLVTTELAPPEKLESLSRLGVQILKISGREGRVDLKELIKVLGERQIANLLVEGGSTLNYQLLQDGLIDKVMFFIAPKLIGGVEAPTPVGGEGVELMEDVFHLFELQVKNLGEDILVTGYLGKGS
ncbi:bifunctional diaminohydroxyphosphoribosylaminopyrimidine deaminase/5-amino-6-(5-phosphoribosylamino)uracil reductase RibD [Candidatus Contubernalis alkalaceticus]|uniref:bifunctional diaminohydroxyphosphoribosylaminopyrimidine deaminase/5-amino-6-(5-phosphoribosylamino)uracil reductase RibD n=1 Tax=Candidatus Contubernalis alkaliaceticus TaxID=338645 RepID=UPI002962551E|nr:bifunctional diaminohydroxyphosphoribosylaminopyrimidine deaminase/5-amino-6-(5-phosphoribosylamino)uracil reductase RibD [Candidatus Contubernalis alkalaceticus]